MGNIDVSRDWGFAGNYVHAMWLMLQQDEPDHYVVATGKCHSVHDLLKIAFHHVGINDWRPYVVQDERFFRPADVSLLIGDATKANAKLGWKPRVDFQQLIEMMVDADLENEKRSPDPQSRSSPVTPHDLVTGSALALTLCWSCRGCYVGPVEVSERNMDRFASTPLGSLSIVCASLRASRRMRSRVILSRERKWSISSAISWGLVGSHIQPAPEPRCLARASRVR